MKTWIGIVLIVLGLLYFNVDGFKKFVQSSFGAPSAQAFGGGTSGVSDETLKILETELGKRFDKKYLTRAEFETLYNLIKKDIKSKADRDKVEAELKKLDKDKLSTADLCEALLKCNCLSAKGKETVARIANQTATPGSAATTRPADPAPTTAPQLPTFIPIPVAGDVRVDVNNEITLGDNTISFGDVTFPIPANNSDPVVVVPNFPMNVIIVIDGDTYYGNMATLTGTDWCAAFEKCLLEGCDPVHLMALAILCDWQSTHLTPAPTVVFTPGPSPTARPWISSTPGATSPPGNTVTPTPVIVPDPATATATPAPGSVPTATIEPTPTNATPTIPRSCAEGDIVSDRKDSFALYYNGRDLLQSCLKQEDRREAVEWSFTSPVGGWYRFDGIGSMVRYDHDKDASSPEIVIVNYVNNVCVTLVKDGWYKVTQRPSNEGGIRFRPDPTCGGGPAAPTSTPHPIVTPGVGNPAPDPGTVRLLSTFGIDDPYRIVENSKMDIEQDLLPVEGQRDSFTREFVAPRNGRYLLKAVSSWIIGPNVNNGYGNDEEIRLQIGATYSVSTPNDRRFNGGIYLVRLGP